MCILMCILWFPPTVRHTCTSGWKFWIALRRECNGLVTSDLLLLTVRTLNRTKQRLTETCHEWCTNNPIYTYSTYLNMHFCSCKSLDLMFDVCIIISTRKADDHPPFIPYAATMETNSLRVLSSKRKENTTQLWLTFISGRFYLQPGLRMYSYWLNLGHQHGVDGAWHRAW